MSKKILVIDDEQAVVDVVKILLESEGYEVDTAADGEEGIKKIKIDKPDVIILDVMMPKMSGFMMAELLKRDEANKDIPIILLTATAPLAGTIQLEMPTPYKLAKPFKPDELLNTIQKALA